MSPLDTRSHSLHILDHLPQGVCILCRTWTVVFWNQCLEDWTGILKSTIVGTPVETQFPHLGTPKYTSRLGPLFEGGPPATFSSQFHPQFLPCSHPDGQPRIQQTIAKALWDESSKQWRILVIIQDISDLHRQACVSQRLRKQAHGEIAERKKAESTLKEQNHLLALDAEVGRIINQTQELPSLLQQCTQAIVNHLHASFARIWTLNPTQQILELQASAGLYTHLNGPHSRIHVGQYKIGQIAAEKKPHLTNAVIGDPRVPEQEWAKQEGLVAFAGYPLLSDQVVLGVMALFARHPLSDLTMHTLQMVGDRITTAIERQNVLQANQELSQRNERILASAGEGIYGVDLEGRTTFVNPAGATMLGYEPQELIGLSMHATIHHTKTDGSAYPREECPIYAAFTDSVIHQIEDEVLWRKDGTAMPVEYISTPIRDERNRLCGAVVIFTDITERQAAEKQRQKDSRDLDEKNKELLITRNQALTAAKSKAEFLSTMSHEIRTPLNGVIGMTDLLLDTDLDADQQEMIHIVKKSGEFLLAIINDILDYSKIDAGKLNLEEIDFDLRTAIDEVLEILAERAHCKGLELISLIDASTPQEFRGDPSRIRQILFNLIGNAIKFTERGEVMVKVSLVSNPSESPMVNFSITDTGIGICAEDQQQLFEPFTQADRSTTRNFGGTGLGLTICKRLVTLMNGEIGLVSEAGQGSTFWVTVPFRHPSSSRISPMACPSLYGRHLCIVETHDTIRFLLQHYAESWGIVCATARNGSEGLSLLKERAQQGQPFDVAILDQTISESIQEDGLSLGRAIRQDPMLAHTPLILLTSFGQRGDAQFAQEAGFNGYLTKPVRQQHFQQCLHLVLGRRTLSTQDTQAHTLITRHTIEEAQARAQVKILLAEDNLVNQKVAVRMLHKLGYRVDVAANGMEAVKAVGQTSYDLILMDCHMPEMNGYSATQLIRKAEQEKQNHSEAVQVQVPENSSSTRHPRECPSHHLPIIAMTANAMKEERECCREAGMDDFLAKPVLLNDLENMINAWLPNCSTSTFMDHPISETNSLPSASVSRCLDETVLQILKTLGGKDDPEFFPTVVNQFLADLPRHCEGIKQAIDHQDPGALMKAAHACQGSCRLIGAISLAEVSYTLELMGRNGIWKGVAKNFEQWLKEKDYTIQAFQQDQLPSSALWSHPA